jgi:eight transmembrane protein EpsH (proposed exosortase)
MVRHKDQQVQEAPAAEPTDNPLALPVVSQIHLTPRLGLGLIVLAVGTWAYFPTLQEIVTAWNQEADYSHGYLVIPMAILFLWLQRKAFPGISEGGWLWGGLLVLVSVSMRLLAGTYFIEAVDAWSLLLWLAGCVTILFGWPVLRWSAPSIAFLIFMIPLPFRVEGLLSLPLQRIATKISCWGLQLLGQPAIAEGNTILVGDHQLEVAQACSGLRLFVSILALGIAYLMLVRRSWWERLVLLAAVVPIAIVANSARIIATGLLYEFASSETAHRFSHDLAGWAMIPFAALLFWLVLWYLGKLFQEHEQLGVENLVRRIETSIQ